MAPPRGPRAAALGCTLLLASALAVAFGPAFTAPAPLAGEAQQDSLNLLGPSVLGQASPPAASGGSRAAVAADSSSSLSFGCLAAALCALSCAASRRSAAQKRNLVACRYFPSACGRPKQKVLRRLEPFGAIPAWTRKPLLRRRLIQPWRKHPTRRPSFYKRQLLEKQRVRFHYNVNEHQLQVYMQRAFRKGVEYPIDNFLQQLESRLDNFCWRVGLCPNMAAARHFVRQGHMQIYIGAKDKEWRSVNIPSIRLKVGDKIRVRPTQGSKNHAKFYAESMAAAPKVPDHLKWDAEKLEGEYLDICDPYDFGLDVQQNYITMWYSGQRGLRRRHIRYFEGTMKVISKRYNGGRTRPTPENILNIKRGVGLNSRGRSRPPCLWGRKKPLNSPYYD